MRRSNSENLGAANSSMSVRVAATVFSSIALYNCAELIILILLTFKRYRSLYFWSLLLSVVLGVIPATIGDLLQYVVLAPVWLSFALSQLGFYFMVPGQSVVLYSRLHLVSQNDRMLRILRWVLIISTTTILIPETVLYAGWAFANSSSWNLAYSIIERIQVTWFSIQETVLSTTYIVETINLLRAGPDTTSRRKKILYELIAINIIAISMDVSLTVLELTGLYFTQVLLKTMVYSIKLKLELAVLGRLINVASHARTSQMLDAVQDDPSYNVSSQVSERNLWGNLWSSG